MLNPISVRIDPMGKLHGAQKELCEFSHKGLRHLKKEFCRRPTLCIWI